MAVYKSGYTGSEIDEAVKSVRTGGGLSIE